MSVDLLYPIEWNNAKYEKLTIRRMKARDTLIAESEPDQIMAGYKMFATLAGVDVEVILELDIEDLERVSEAAAPLMGKSYQADLTAKVKASAGETSSS